VLVADDSSTNRALMRAMLCRLGHHCDCAGGGADAIAAVLCAFYDIVFMDHRMPAMDGVQATRIIRSHGGICATMPIVALTADICEDLAERFRAAGAHAMLKKPITLAALLGCIEDLGRAGDGA